jgi:hypothetical protein
MDDAVLWRRESNGFAEAETLVTTCANFQPVASKFCSGGGNLDPIFCMQACGYIAGSGCVISIMRLLMRRQL